MHMQGGLAEGASEQFRDAEAALSLLANLLKADPGLGLELAQMPICGGSATDLPSMLAAAINLLCGLSTPPVALIGAFPVVLVLAPGWTCHAATIFKPGLCVGPPRPIK